MKLSGDARFREEQSMHRAEVSMMVCSKVMINVARKLKDLKNTYSSARSNAR